MYNILDYGAIGDGVTNNTECIRKAIEHCREEGGGTVYIPAGIFLTGTVELYSNMTLFLENGATLLGSPKITDYEDTGEKPEGDRLPWHLVQIIDASNVRITGEGIIDGQGEAYWVYDHGYYLHVGKGETQYRPSAMVYIKDCENVKITQLSLNNSAGWNLHLYRSKDIRIDNVSMKNNWLGPNTDGIDINGCQNVTINNSNIEAGDDGICLKTTEEAGICERITISNCMILSRTCGIKIGTESYHDFKQITCTACTIYDSERAIGIYVYDGGKLEDMIVTDCQVKTGKNPPNSLERPIHIIARKREESSVASEIKNVMFSNIILHSEGRIIIAGENEHQIKNIIFRHMLYDITGRQELSEFKNPKPSLSQFAKTLPHIRTKNAYIVAHGVDQLEIANIMYDCDKDLDLSNRDQIYLEKVNHVITKNIQNTVYCSLKKLGREV